MELPKIVGGRVSQLRQQHGMSQQALGDRLGELLGDAWTRQAVSNMEKGGRASAIAELVAVAAVLDTSLLDLLAPPAGLEQVTLPGAVLDRDDYKNRLEHRTDRVQALENENERLHSVLVEQTQRMQAIHGEYLRGLRDFATAASPTRDVTHAQRELLNLQKGEGDQ